MDLDRKVSAVNFTLWKVHSMDIFPTDTDKATMGIFQHKLCFTCYIFVK